MSLLLEALKKAEKAKRANTADVPTRAMPATDSGVRPDLALEISESPENIAAYPQFNSSKAQSDALPSLATPEVELPEKNREQAFPEISLAEMEAPEPSPAPREMIVAPALDAAPTPPPAEPTDADRVDFAALDFSATEADAQIAEADEAALPAPVSVFEKKIEPVLSLDFPEPPPPTAPQASEPPPPAMPTAVAPREPAPLQQDAAPVSAKTAPTPEPSAAQALPPTTPDTNADTAKQQEAAKKILAAKQDQPKRNFKRLGVILLVSMAVGAAGAYYYWQALDKLTPPLPAQPAPLAVAPPELQQPDTPPDKADKETPLREGKESAAPHRAGEEVSADTSQKPSQHESSSVEKPTAPKKAAEKPAVSTKPREVPPAEPPPAKKTSSTPNELDKATVKASSTSLSDSGIKFRRDAGDTRLDPLLASAYQAFMAGDVGKAENDYRKALQQTPNNRDALLGLAAIAANRGQAQEAATHYLRVLQLDPKDAAAQAGLIGLRGYSDPTLSESRLKTLLAQQPDAGYLHFALGNLYAYQARWSEAQEAYFNALHSDAGNADYAFNLAVSLDHLDQRKPALVYYQRALTLVKERSASFDGEQLKKRIHELQAN